MLLLPRAGEVAFVDVPGHERFVRHMVAGAGGVDAVVADNGVVVNYVTNNPAAKFKTVSDKAFVPEQYGFAVKKGNTELLEKLNKGLADIKADGTYDQIYAKYFGAPPAKAEPAASAASK